MKTELTFVLALALAPCLTAQADAFDPVKTTIKTNLDAIRANPDSFKGVAVTFQMQFCSLGEVSNPFFTRFVPSEYTNFYGWSTNQEIWRRAEYDDVCGTLFMKKTNENLQKVHDLKLYDRIEVVGVVRNTFQQRPWIEVIRFTDVPGKVDTPTLSHLYRGETFMQRRQWNRAVSELSLAGAGSAPDPVMAAVHENLGVCYLRIGEADAALSNLQTAQALRGDNTDAEFEELLRTARSNPELQLDREVESVEVGDHERPMWEAFEDATAAPIR